MDHREALHVLYNTNTMNPQANGEGHDGRSVLLSKSQKAETLKQRTNLRKMCTNITRVFHGMYSGFREYSNPFLNDSTVLGNRRARNSLQ